MSATEFEQTLQDILCRELPACERLIKAERLSGGASQETYRLIIATAQGELTLCMRRAPGGAAASEAVEGYPGLPVEAKLMQIAGTQGIPEPQIHYILEPADGLGEGFIMQWLDGETLGARIVKSESLASVRPKLAYQCGEILARIHAIDLDQTGLRDALTEHSAAGFIETTWQRYKEFETPQPMIDYAARWLLENLPASPRSTLVHNDFRNGNLMINESGVAAVLDWEIAHIGDPMRDLGWICTNSWRFGRAELTVGGFGELDDLIRGYEAASGTVVDPEHVKFWIVFGSFWWAVGCLGMAHHFRTGPDRTVERAAIGRRSSECQVDCVNLLIPGPVDVPQGDDLATDLDMPGIDELVTSVQEFLRQEVMPNTDGRLNFLSRVGGNSLDIVLRELALGPSHRHNELSGLQSLLASDTSDLSALRWQLVHALRDGSMALNTPGLADHLRQTVVTQIAIDQPKYSGYRQALEPSGNM